MYLMHYSSLTWNEILDMSHEERRYFHRRLSNIIKLENSHN